MRLSPRVFAILALYAALFSVTASASANEFNYNNMFLIAAKLNPLFDPDSALEAFVRLFRPSIWASFHDDEFVLKQKEQESLPIMKKMVADYDLNQPVTFVANLKLGDYDFKDHFFPLADYDANHFYYVDQTCCRGVPNRIKVYFANSDLLARIPLDEAAAKAFLDRRKKSAEGYVDRAIAAQISFVPRTLAGEDEVTADLVKVVFLDSRFGNVPVATEVAPTH